MFIRLNSLFDSGIVKARY